MASLCICSESCICKEIKIFVFLIKKKLMGNLVQFLHILVHFPSFILLVYFLNSAKEVNGSTTRVLDLRQRLDLKESGIVQPADCFPNVSDSTYCRFKSY